MRCIFSPSLDLQAGIWRICCGVAIALLGFIAAIVNSITAITIMKHKELQTQYCKVLLSLSISDFLVGVFVSPLYVAQHFNFNLLNDCTVDHIKRFSADVLLSSSLCMLVLIAYHRYKTIQSSKLKADLPKKFFIPILSSCWLIPLLGAILNDVLNLGDVFSAIRAGSLFLLLAMTCIYYVLLLRFLHAWKKKARIKKNMRSSNRQRKTLQSVLLLLTCFYVLYVPATIQFIVRALSISADKQLIAKLYTVSVIFSVVNSTVNPLVYYVNIPHFKACVLKMMMGKRGVKNRNITLVRSTLKTDQSIMVSSSKLPSSKLAVAYHK